MSTGLPLPAALWDRLPPEARALILPLRAEAAELLGTPSQAAVSTALGEATASAAAETLAGAPLATTVSPRSPR
jgi:hypothetical protein